jgi:hypothetical protein
LKKLLAILLLLGSLVYSSSKPLENSKKEWIATGVKALYRFDFNQADSISKAILIKHPEWPEAHLLRAHFYWYQIIGGLNSTENRLALKKSLTLAEKQLPSRIQQFRYHEQYFAKISSQVLKARLDAMEGNTFQAFVKLNESIDFLKHTLGKEQEFEYYQLSSGLYLYYRDYALNRYPVLFPYLIWLPSGNESEGLRMLRQAADSDDEYLSTEANYFMMKICMDRKWWKEALGYSVKLNNRYPENLLFLYLKLSYY